MRENGVRPNIVVKILVVTGFLAVLKHVVSPTSMHVRLISCNCYLSVNIKVLKIVRYAEHTCNYLVISDNWFNGKISGFQEGTLI
jgi:hypothetical protein